MNIDSLKGIWEQVKGKVKQEWGELTDDDITHISGKKDELVGKLRERYGYNKEEAEKKIKTFLDKHDSYDNKE